VERLTREAQCARFSCVFLFFKPLNTHNNSLIFAHTSAPDLEWFLHVW
jgi:hypothetical protein